VATNQMKKKIVLIVVAIIILVGLFIALKPSSKPAQQPALTTFNYVINNGQITSGPDTITLKQGDAVKIEVTSDTNDELHLHGYNKEIELEPNKPTSIDFNANLTGRFELELHKADKVIAQVEVQPN
jgi:FtsP/CotA-like multicopper oxidase with cupredoxin domain